jgi:hypothetical protein
MAAKRKKKRSKVMRRVFGERSKMQVKKLMAKHGIQGELRGAGKAWEVELPDEAAKNKFQREVGPTGGYKTGYGGWVLKPGHKDKGDWNDPSSRWHY